MVLHIGAIFFCCFLSLSLALDLSSCGTAKSCIYSSPGCLPTSPSCLVFTYSYDSSQNVFNMELSGGTGGGAQYVGVAFSPTGRMENSDFYYCSGTAFRSGVIVNRSPPTIDASLPTQVSAGNTMTNSGVAECTFVRPASVTKEIGSTPTTFNLATTQYHLLLAVGDLSGNQLAYHQTNHYSSGPYDYTVILQTSDESTPASTTTTTTTTTSQQVVDDGTGCGTRIGCFRNPDGCLPESSGCQFLSWTYDSAENSFNFDIVGGSTNQYAAIAFGTQKAMVDADLYFCTQNGLNSGAIIARNLEPSVANSIPSGITNVNSSISNGVMRCSFTRPASITKTIGTGENDFNLATTSYYLLYAVGSFAGDQLNYHGGAETNRALSGDPIDFKSFEAASGGGSNTRNLIKAHASLMLIAWITCASIGAIIARHFKPLWHGKTLGGVKVWFQLHRTLMVAAVLCTAIAFILIFVAIETFSGAQAGAHPIIGIVVTALALLNPLMALCRPHPGEPRRYIFNWAHWFVGSSARILGLVAIFLGVDLDRLNLPEWDTWVLVGFVVFHVVTEIVLEVVSAMYGHIAGYRKKKKTDDIDLGGDDNPQDDPPPKGSGIKYAILTIYILVNLSFLITFIVYVARN